MVLKPPPAKAGRPRTPAASAAPPPARAEAPGAWTDRRVRFLAALAAPAAAGLLAGLLTPRGPITAAEGLVTIGGTLLVGLAAGWALRSRWAMLLAPATFVLVLELARLGVDGPTVDGIHLTTYGLIAFAVGRGVHGLLALLPMVLGAALGAALVRRAAGPTFVHGAARAGLYARRAVTAAAALLLLVLAAGIARPAETDAIPGPDGAPLAGSVAELATVTVGGHEQALLIRGHSTENPVLLFLAGGPGGSELGAMRRHLEALERDFVVVTWDQRGTGKSYGALDPVSTLTLDRAVADAIEVTDHLRGRFGAEKIYLVGQSWGTILGVRAVQRRPELYEAFVGVGQMVSPRETDRIFYEDTLAWARASGRDGLVASLTEIGPPPYERMLDYTTLLAHERDVYPYDRTANSEGAGQMGENIFVEEYTLLEQLHVFAGVLDTFSVLYPQIQDVDFRRDATELDVPVYLVQGRHEARGRAEPAEEWYRTLRAPAKRLSVFATSGHRPLWEQPAEFHRLMTETVLAGTRLER
jgi:proline iminopeptidase